MNTPTFQQRLEEVFQKLVYEQLPIKTTEIGWEAVGEQVQEAQAQITQLVEELIGQDEQKHSTYAGHSHRQTGRNQLRAEIRNNLKEGMK